MTAQSRIDRRAEGCTVVLCTASTCCTALHSSLMSALRAAVRSSTHGILVTTGCRLGSLACRSRDPGPLLVVQPCDRHRQPVGFAVLLGPLLGDADVVAVDEWLRAGSFDPTVLPGHLRTTQQAVRAAAQN